jgi:hypothetical protein
MAAGLTTGSSFFLVSSVHALKEQIIVADNDLQKCWQYHAEHF